MPSDPPAADGAAPGPRNAAGATVGLIGAGPMGAALAGLLTRAGFGVTAYDPSPEARANVVAEGATAAGSAQEVFAAARTTIVCISTPGALEATVQAALAAIAGGATPGIVIETSTLPIPVKEAARATLAEAGATLLDCPVSGTSAQARAGDLVVFASGDADAVEACRPVFEAVARRTFSLGAFGAGMRLKLLANHLVGLHSLVAAEMLMLAQAAGLDPATTVEALGDSAGASRMLQVRGPLMVRGEFTPPTGAIDIIVKDGAMILEMAKDAGCEMPMFERAYALYAEAQRAGMGGDDIAGIIAHLTDRFRDAGKAPA